MKDKNRTSQAESPLMVQNRQRNAIINRDYDEYLLEYENSADSKEKSTCKQRCCRCCLITTLIIIVLVLLIFISLFVILPISFKYSVEMQRNLVFERHINSEEREFTNFGKYGIEATRNLYVNITTNDEKITLGVWHVLPLALVYQAVENDEYNYEMALRENTFPVLLYFHDSTGNRISDVNKFRILRRFFHVIVFDYRSYGDSTQAELNEDLVVKDCVQLYLWLDSQTNADVFVWGYSLGASLSTSAILKLNREGVTPRGLFLEAPFTSLKEEAHYFPVTKLFAWLPWFEATIVDPLEENGFLFKTEESILHVDCPILILSAEDDYIVPSILSVKLVGIAKQMREVDVQGNITFHSFPEDLQLGHRNIYRASQLPDYIRDHIKDCKDFYDNVG